MSDSEVDVRLVRFIAPVMVFALSTPAQAKHACQSPDVIEAVQVRQLQIEMMVSTMRCDSSEYNFRQRYAAFMEAINPLLTDNAALLQSKLKLHSNSAFDRYITNLANEAQNISQTDPNFCTQAVQIIEHVATLSTPEIPAVAVQAVPHPFGVTACPVRAKRK